jgi:hypothetical protein
MQNDSTMISLGADLYPANSKWAPKRYLVVPGMMPTLAQRSVIQIIAHRGGAENRLKTVSLFS